MFEWQKTKATTAINIGTGGIVISNGDVVNNQDDSGITINSDANGTRDIRVGGIHIVQKGKGSLSQGENPSGDLKITRVNVNGQPVEQFCGPGSSRGGRYYNELIVKPAVYVKGYINKQAEIFITNKNKTPYHFWYGDGTKTCQIRAKTLTIGDAIYGYSSETSQKSYSSSSSPWQTLCKLLVGVGAVYILWRGFKRFN